MTKKQRTNKELETTIGEVVLFLIKWVIVYYVCTHIYHLQALIRGYKVFVIYFGENVIEDYKQWMENLRENGYIK